MPIATSQLPYIIWIGHLSPPLTSKNSQQGTWSGGEIVPAWNDYICFLHQLANYLFT
jgi:hypothetical protein